MKKITIVFLVLIVAGGLFLVYQKSSTRQGTELTQEQTNDIQKLESKVDNQLAVTLTVTPYNILPESKEWKFDVDINTHSVELNQDMVNVAILIDNQGKEYKPLRWEGSPVGGHHREGTLIFSQINPSPKSLTLKISGIGNTVRNFDWQVNK